MIKKCLFILFIVHCLLFTIVYAADTPAKSKLSRTPEAVEKGKVIYFTLMIKRSFQINCLKGFLFIFHF